jgi:hypothetical protein
MNNKTVVENENSIEEMKERIEWLEKEKQKCLETIEQQLPAPRPVLEILKNGFYDVSWKELVRSMKVNGFAGIHIHYSYEDGKQYIERVTKKQILDEIKDGFVSADQEFDEYISNQHDIDDGVFTVFCDGYDKLEEVEEWDDEPVNIWFSVSKKCRSLLTIEEIEKHLMPIANGMSANELGEYIESKYLNGEYEEEENHEGYLMDASHIHICNITKE